MYCDNLTLAGIITVLAVGLFTLRTMVRGNQFGWSLLSWTAALTQRKRPVADPDPPVLGCEDRQQAC